MKALKDLAAEAEFEAYIELIRAVEAKLEPIMQEWRDSGECWRYPTPQTAKYFALSREWHRLAAILDGLKDGAT